MVRSLSYGQCTVARVAPVARAARVALPARVEPVESVARIESLSVFFKPHNVRKNEVRIGGSAERKNAPKMRGLKIKLTV